jgi:hypothetical protein
VQKEHQARSRKKLRDENTVRQIYVLVTVNNTCHLHDLPSTVLPSSYSCSKHETNHAIWFWNSAICSLRTALHLEKNNPSRFKDCKKAGSEPMVLFKLKKLILIQSSLALGESVSWFEINTSTRTRCHFQLTRKMQKQAAGKNLLYNVHTKLPWRKQLWFQSPECGTNLQETAAWRPSRYRSSYRVRIYSRSNELKQQSERHRVHPSWNP